MSMFPVKFMIGAATAAHQVEGNNIHSDFWTMEQLPHTMYKEPSLDAVDHYNRFEEDIKLMADAGLNAYRFSIEWARIEPEEGKWVEAEVEHYRKVIQCCRSYGVEPVVTMHHFSSPKWLIQRGGWENSKTADLFAGYCERLARELGDNLEYVCTINEANMGIQIGKLMRDIQMRMMSGGDIQVGVNVTGGDNMMKYMMEAGEAFGMDPRHLNTFHSPRTAIGDGVIIEAHCKARDAMKAACPHLKVGVTLSLHDFQPLDGGEQNAKVEWIEEFTHYLPYIENDDFLGVQNYTRKLIGPDGTVQPSKDAPVTQMGYEDYPSAISNVIRKVAADYRGEIIVTENGLSTADDKRRVEFIREALQGVRKCIDDGIPVKGYLYWSLLDNFEWQLGFGPTFGLIAVDRTTQTRYPKESLTFLGTQG